MKLLLPVAWLYSLGMTLRNRLFEWGVLTQTAVGVPVISVGNLTVGGTGKTPLVEYIVGALIARGVRVGVVSRGYNRTSSGVVVVSDGKNVLSKADAGGDEPVQIAAKFRDAIVVVGEKRVDAAHQAVALGAQVIVADDGFQHRYIKRDLNIVVIDATADITREAVLPAGSLREPISGLSRADLVAFSKVDEVNGGQFPMETALRKYFTGAFCKYRYVLKEVRRAGDDGPVSLDVLRTMSLLAFSGIGKHGAFLSELNKAKLVPVTDLRFSDHHRYAEHDLEILSSLGKSMQVDAFVTTEKDIVRLRADTDLMRRLLGGLPVFYVVIEVDVLQGQDELLSRIEKISGGSNHHGHRDNGNIQQEA